MVQNQGKKESKSHTALRFEAALTILCAIALATGFFGSLSGVITGDTARYFYMAAYLTGGYAGLVESVRALLRRELNVDILMILAAIGAAVIDNWLEGAVLLFLFSLSNTLQDYAMGRSRRAIQSLMELRPDEALIRYPDGREKRIPVEQLKIGDSIVVKPGERIPIDGIVKSGISSVNQSAITGESAPVPKEAGKEVYAATMNEDGVLEIAVTKLAGETTLAKIIELVEQAQSEKAPTQRFLEDFEPKYAAGVIIGTILLVLIPYYILGQPFDDVFYRAMTILVVASPCALVISMPASILSAIANAARNGILFKGGAYLEQAAAISAIAFDKTGTLTTGRSALTDILLCPSANGRNGNGELTEEAVLTFAASAEEHSEHHLAAAIVREAEARGLSYPKAENVQAEIGKGVMARVRRNQVKIGNKKLFNGKIDNIPGDIAEQIRRLEEEGKTVIYVGVDEQLVGAFAFADQIREQAPAALKALRKLGVDKFVILTGDLEGVARSVAKKLNIERFYAELLPEEKVSIIKEIARTETVAMVGDGVNDAPALASSSLGIAMGAAGTDVALETADVVLMGDDLTRLPYIINLSRKARKVVWQNISFSLAVIVMLVASVFLFELPLPLGVVGHEGSTLLVVLNGLRLLRS